MLLLAEFLTSEDVLRATTSAYAAGYRRMDAYSPMPVEGLVRGDRVHEELASRSIVLIGGVVGGLPAVMASSGMPRSINYPLINIGGRPYQQLAVVHPDHLRDDGPDGGVRGGLRDARAERPAEAAITRSSTRAELRPREPRADIFLSILADDPLFDVEETGKFLQGLGPVDRSPEFEAD